MEHGSGNVLSDTSPDLRTLFAEALEQGSPEELRSYVDSVCGANGDLREQLEGLLHAHQEAGMFLGGSSRQGAASDPPIHSELLGSQIGPYRLLRQIGEGGFGMVFEAEQLEPIHRQVALKIIKPGTHSPIGSEVISRFEAERQALALMDHPHIARVLDAGTTASGHPYFVMELVHGVPITTYCDDHQLTPRQRLELFVPVCQAIQHAHQKGIIHRDIKPSNVMVAQYDGRPAPKVIDFGVAKATETTDSRWSERMRFTQFGTMIGTLEYMSPEQADMSRQGVDTRSDIYSLGVMLYELLTGSTPLTPKRLKDAALGEMLRIIREEEPAVPSLRLSDSGEALASIASQRHTEPAKLTKLVRGELDWIVMKALDKDRGRRYETAIGFAHDIERYLNDEPVRAGPPSTGYRLRKFLHRNLGAVLAGASLAILLLLGILGTSLGLFRARRAEHAANVAAQAEARQRIRAEQQLDRAQTAESLAKEEAAIAQAVNNFLQNDLLAEAAPENNARDKQVTVLELLGRAADRVSGQFDNQPRTEAAIQQIIGETYVKLGEYKTARSHLERALEIRRRELGNDHRDTLTSINDLAVLHKFQGDYKEAEVLYLEALDGRSRMMGEAHPDTLVTMHNLGNLYINQRNFKKAQPIIEKTLEVFRRVLGNEDPQTLSALNNLVMLYVTERELDKAEPLAVEAVATHRRVVGDDHPNSLAAKNNLARLYRAQGRLSEADPLYRETLEACKRVLGDEHPHTIVSMNNLAMLYREQGQVRKAERLFLESLECARRVLGEKHPGTLTIMNELAILFHGENQFAKAEPLYLQVIEVRSQTLGADNPLTLAAMNKLVLLYESLGNKRLAAKWRNERESRSHKKKPTGDGATDKNRSESAWGKALRKSNARIETSATVALAGVTGLLWVPTDTTTGRRRRVIGTRRVSRCWRTSAGRFCV